tara:strand:+ start:8266 stop:8700 length:435 start_codon:yes stop_codon:yes gene_type:complete
MCDCSCDQNKNYEKVYPKLIRKTPSKIEGFQTKNIDKNEVKQFADRYKTYVQNEKTEGFTNIFMSNIETLDESCNYDASFNKIIDMQKDNENMRRDLDEKLLELNKTKYSIHREEAKYKQMIEVRDLVFYTMSGLLIYYIFVEL